MNSQHLHARGVLGALSVSVAVLLACASVAYGQPSSREAAVELARQGEYEPAIAQLSAMARSSSDLAIRYDLMTILDWAGRDAAVIDVWLQMGSPVALPTYVRVALVDALIAQQQWSQANRVIRAWLPEEPDSVDAIFFDGQVLQAEGDRFGALLQYQNAQRLAPDNQKIRDRTAEVLTELGAVSAAARLSQPSANLNASVAAQQVRWGLQLQSVVPTRPYIRLDAAIATLKDQIAVAQRDQPDNEGLLRRLHADLAIALSGRQDLSGVLAQLDYLESTGGIPGYVRVVQGDALLALGHAERSRAVFEAVLIDQPNNRQAQQGLLGALIALRQWQGAYDLADQIEPKASLWLSRSTIPYANDAWLDARVQAALIRSWAQQPELAWNMISPLLESAPADPDVQIAGAAIATAQGWPRLGEYHAAVAYNLAPDSKASQLALAQARMSRNQWAQARAGLSKLERDYASDAEVKQFAKELAVQDMYELVVDLQAENEAGQSFYAPGDGYQTSAYLYSPRINDRWRFYAGTTAGRARSPDVFSATRQRVGIGALIQWPDVEVDASVWQNFGSVDKTSVDLDASWSPDDYWRFNAGLSSFTTDMPLRALAYGVTANELSVGTSYAWSNSSDVGLSYGAQQFSDGNFRQRLLLNANHLVYSAPELQVMLLPSIYASSNSDASVDYFSPKQDLALNLVAQGERVLWRRGEMSFGDRLQLGAGNYWQQSFGNGFIAEASYQQVFSIDPSFEVTYGVSWSRRVYDGDPENAWQAMLNTVVRF